MFSNWFKKKDLDVPELETIEVAPEIVIPEPTRRELYDAAVAEVVQKRVEALILRGLTEISTDPEVVQQTKDAIEFNGGIARVYDTDLEVINKRFPKAHFYEEAYSGTYLQVPVANIKGLVKYLTKQYLSE